MPISEDTVQHTPYVLYSTMTPPPFSHTYNVSVRTGQIDGWKSKLPWEMQEFGQKKKAEPFLPTPASLCHFKPEHPLWSPYPGLSIYHYGTYGLQNSRFLLKIDDKHAYFFTLATIVSACMQKRPIKSSPSVSWTLLEYFSYLKTLPSLFLSSPGCTGNWSRRWIRWHQTPPQRIDPFSTGNAAHSRGVSQ